MQNRWQRDELEIWVCQKSLKILFLSKNKYPDQIIEAYKKGGNSAVDDDYTVFCQAINGMDIMGKIIESKTGENTKPKNEIKIEKIEVIKDYDFNK